MICKGGKAPAAFGAGVTHARNCLTVNVTGKVGGTAKRLYFLARVVCHLANRTDVKVGRRHLTYTKSQNP